ncbi:MAG: hypothetical protein IKF38_00395 [Clostridia bacterium]|nr:hypothetical protein [Clostridia bacterium]
MNIKNEKGYLGTDITVAIIIILLFISVTSSIFFNLTKSSKGIERESQATYIASEVIESVKLIPYSNLDITATQTQIIKNDDSYGYIGNKGTIVNLDGNIEIDAGYTCYITVENYVPENYQPQEGEETDYIKIVTVQVDYKLANEQKSITLKTSILREV